MIRGLGVAAIVLVAAPAFANGGAEQCFDKDELVYVECEAPPGPAQRDDAFYIGGRLGVAYIPDDSEVEDGMYGFEILGLPFRVGYQADILLTWDPTMVGSGFVGYVFKDVEDGLSLRIEGEVGRIEAEGSTEVAISAQLPIFGSIDISEDNLPATAEVTFGLVNFYADVEMIEGIDLIVGGGAGYADFSIEADGAVREANAPAFAAAAGVGFEPVDGVVLEALYRALYLEAEINGATYEAGAQPRMSVSVWISDLLFGFYVYVSGPCCKARRPDFCFR